MDIADKRRVSAAAGRPGTRHQASVPGKIQSNVATGYRVQSCGLAALIHRENKLIIQKIMRRERTHFVFCFTVNALWTNSIKMILLRCRDDRFCMEQVTGERTEDRCRKIALFNIQSFIYKSAIIMQEYIFCRLTDWH